MRSSRLKAKKLHCFQRFYYKLKTEYNLLPASLVVVERKKKNRIERMRKKKMIIKEGRKKKTETV